MNDKAGSAHVFSQLFAHANWHTKNDAPLLTPGTIEPWVHQQIREYCTEVKGIHFQEVGGTADHVHLVFQFEPTIKLSEFLGQVKGAVAYKANRHFARQAIEWQRGYGAVTFSKRHLNTLVEYARNQKKHHAEGTTIDPLEQWGEDA
jgi:putative transposase